MQYTEQQINEWKTKAEKWDALEQRIAKYYPDEDDYKELNDTEDAEGDLCDIGEIAAIAFGFM